MVTTMGTNDTTAPSLADLNSEEAKKYYGSSVFIGMLFLPAVIGNSHILHIYIFKKKPSNTRVYVCFMAVLDMTNCLVCYPFHVVDCALPYMFYSDAACKIFTFMSYFVNISIPLCLFIISIDRYKIICKPFGPQISLRLCKLLCVFTLMFSFVLSTPSLIMYESVPIETRADGVQGRECNVSNEFESWFVIYIGVLSLLTTIDAIVLIVLYSFMGLSIRKQKILLKNNGIDYKTSWNSSIHKRTSFYEDKSSKGGNTSGRERDTKIFVEVPEENKTSNTECDTNTQISETHLDNNTAILNNNKCDIKTQISETNLNNNCVILNNNECGTKTQISETISIAHTGNLAANRHVSVSNTQYNEDVDITEETVKSRKVTLYQQLEKSSKLESQNNISVIARPRNSSLIKAGVTRFRKNTDDKQTTDTIPKENKLFEGLRRISTKIKGRINRKSSAIERVTYMFFWVTFIFVISYWPNPVLRVVRWFHEDWYDSIGFSGQVVYHIMVVSVFLVSATNFFIYLFFDSKFRRDIKQWYITMFCRKR